MSFLSVMAAAVDVVGLRRSRAGRGVIRLVNVLGNRGGRLLYLRGGKPVLVEGHRMFLADRNAPSLNFVNSMVHDQYEPETKAVLESLIRENMTVFDVGAHVGNYTLLAARLVGPKGHVYAFEAEPENFRLLKRNVELNGYTNVTCVNKAVSNVCGTLILYVSRQGNDRHSIVNQGSVAAAAKVEVPAITLDAFVLSSGITRVDTIKMDIEGAEPMAFEGMTRLLQQRERLSIVMEFAPEILRRSGADTAGFLRALMKQGITLAPVETGVPPELFESGNAAGILVEAEKRGAINLLCVKHARTEAALRA